MQQTEGRLRSGLGILNVDDIEVWAEFALTFGGLPCLPATKTKAKFRVSARQRPGKMGWQ